MNVLFWINSFPEVSETFIRDQIVGLIDNDINVSVLAYKTLSNTTTALLGYENYNLMHSAYQKKQIIPKSKRKRFLAVLNILYKSRITPNFKPYLKTLNIFKYGKKALTLQHFFILHFLIEKKIEVIHAHYGPNGLSAAIYKNIHPGIKLFTTFHGYDLRLIKNKKSDYYSPLFRSVNAIFSISDYTKKKLISFGADKQLMVDMPNGVDTDFFSPSSKQKSVNQQIKILTVGRLVKEKAIDLAIRSVHSIYKQGYTNIEYNIIGEGKQYSDLLSLVKELQLDDCVNFLGKKDRIAIRKEMQASDLLLLSSKTEILPTVILEAQSCGLPVIATKVGAIGEIIKDDHNGYLCEPEVESISETLIKYLNKDIGIDNNAMRINARREIEENYNQKKIVKRLIESYAQY